MSGKETSTQTPLPTGEVTFFFTDIEGSTRLWEEAPEAMQAAIERHDVLMAHSIERYGGCVVKHRGEGDSVFAVFVDPLNAVKAASELQRAIYHEPWPTPSPVRVRMALHTDEAQLRGNDYFGSAVNRCARLRGIAHGDQVVFSNTTWTQVGAQLPDYVRVHDWGQHYLKDLVEPEHVYQILTKDLPDCLKPLKSQPVATHNLPQSLTPFIGRERELQAVCDELSENRLVTLTGIGGSGKTRLSLEVAKSLQNHFADGVFFIELGTVTDPLLVAQSIAVTLNLRQSASRTSLEDANSNRRQQESVLESLVEHLQSKTMMLVLDNCEHLIQACADVVSALLGRCLNLKILTSSREGLGVAGEHIYPLTTLNVPDPDVLDKPSDHEIQKLLEYEAVNLFVDRLITHQSDFKLDADNAAVVAQICARLDGLPLALELAAARIKMLSLEQIAQRLDDRFKLLSGGSRTALPHHQTLQAAMDWSYDMLPDPERQLLENLSVFVGAFTLVDAEGVCDSGYDVLGVLANLVDKSLVLVDDQQGERMYRMLDTVRHYSRDKLDSAKLEAFRNRHLAWYLDLAETAEPALQGPDQSQWLDRLERAHNNLRTALSWALSQDDPTLALRLGSALWWFWHVRGYWSEGFSQLDEVISKAEGGPDALRAKALNGLGVLTWRLGDYERSNAVMDECLTLYDKLGDQQGEAYALNIMGVVAQRQGDFDRALTLLEKCLEKFRAIDDLRGIGYALNVLGWATFRKGNHTQAAIYCEECMAVRRQLDDKRGMALVLRLWGKVLMQQNDLKHAQELNRECLSLFESLQDKWGMANSYENMAFVAHRVGEQLEAQQLFSQSLSLYQTLGDRAAIASVIEGLARIACTRRDMVRTAQLMGAAQALRDTIQAPMTTSDHADFERYINAARQQLGEKTFEAAHQRGRERTLEDIVQYGLKL